MKVEGVCAHSVHGRAELLQTGDKTGRFHVAASNL